MKWLFTTLVLLFPVLTAGMEHDPEWRYVIRPGDTLIGVSARFLSNPADWPQLQKLNRISNPKRLPPASSLRIPFRLMRQQPAPAKVLKAAGRIELRLPGQQSATMQPGLLLPAGSEIRTLENGFASLQFADGSRMNLPPNTEVQLDTVSLYAGSGMADTRVRLRHGRAEISANPSKQPGNRLEVMTPSAIAAVRGTQFRVSADEGAMHEETLQGNVAVAAAGAEVAVGAEMGTRVEAGKPPMPPVKLLPAPDLSGLPARFERYPLRFPLAKTAGVHGWLGEIVSGAEADTILIEKRGENQVISFAELPDGKYRIRVRGVDMHGLGGLSQEHAFEVDAHPFPPLLSQPGEQAKVRHPRPVLGWTQSGEAVRYRLQLAREASFATPMLDQTIEDTKWSPQADLNPGDYFWRVASIDSSGELGPYTDVRGFEYRALPGVPGLDSGSLKFDSDWMWMELPRLPEGLHYELVLSRSPDLQNPFWKGGAEANRLKAPRPEAGKVYLGARAVESDGTAGPFAIQAVEVPSKPIWPYLLLLAPLLLL